MRKKYITPIITFDDVEEELLNTNVSLSGIVNAVEDKDPTTNPPIKEVEGDAKEAFAFEYYIDTEY